MANSQNYDEYENSYVRLVDSPVYWLVQNGERMEIKSPEEMYANGIKPVVFVTAEQLEGIPAKGAKAPKKAKTESEEK